jgi:hypothetical protein
MSDEINTYRETELREVPLCGPEDRADGEIPEEKVPTPTAGMILSEQ